MKKNLMYNGVEVRCVRVTSDYYAIEVVIPYVDKDTEESKVMRLDFHSPIKLRKRDVALTHID